MVGTPNFALELSNDLVRLLHRAIDDVWVPLSETRPDADDYDTCIADMRKQAAGVVAARSPRVAVILPTSEVLFRDIDVGALDGPAARERANTIAIAKTGLDADDVSVFIADKTSKNLVPVALVTQETLGEAAVFAKSLGFNPVVYSTRWRRHMFPVEPVFVLTKRKTIIAPLALAACGLATIGALSLIWPMTSDQTNAAQTDAIKTDTTQTATLDLTIDADSFVLANAPATMDVTIAKETPPVSPDEGASDDSVHWQEPTQISYAAPKSSVVPKQRPPLTQPPAPRADDQAVPLNTSDLVDGGTLVDAPAQLVTPQVRVAALEPTLTGALSPDGFTLFKGKPPVSPPYRTGTQPEVAQQTSADQSITVRPKPSPFRTASVPPAPAETFEDITPQDLGVPQDQPIGLDPIAAAAAILEAQTEIPAEPAPVEMNLDLDLPQEPQIDFLVMANPDLRGKRPKLRAKSADTTPADLTPADTSVDSGLDEGLLAMASPALKGKTPKLRPTKLSQDTLTSLDIASPALRGKKPKRRPSFQTAALTPTPPVTPEVPAPVISPEMTAAQAALQAEIAAESLRRKNLATASRLAVTKSPFPPKKSSNFATTVKRTRAEGARVASAPATSTRNDAKATSTRNTKTGTPSSTFKKNKLSLVGVYGTNSKRSALFRTPGGRYIKVKNGGRVEGWRISAMGESSVKITKGGRSRTMRITK